ncbi:MAG: hypothetical protein AAB445_00770 [Patescibacteria group bacterium]
MKPAAQLRPGKKRTRTRSSNVAIEKERALARLRVRAEKMLPYSAKPRTFEQIYEELGCINTKDAILLRNAIGKVFSV